MFPRRKRLSRDDFGEIHAGRRFSSPHFSVAVPRRGEGYAVVVGKAAARLSAARHQVKRRVLAVLEGLTLPPSLVVFPKPSALKLSFAEIKEELTTLLEKISR